MNSGPGARVKRFRKTLIRRMFEAARPGAINLGLGEPVGPTPEEVSQGGLDAIREGRTGYTPTAGRRDLQEAIAAQCSPPASPENVVVTAGSQEALFAALMLFVEPGREVLVPDPGYPAYRNIVEMLGGAARSYPLKESNGYRLRSADLLGLLSTDTCAVILNGPANPTGAVPRSEELQRSLATLAERNVPFVSDEIYSGLAWEPPQPSPAEISPGGGIVVSGLSKSHAMTGWRIGWAMAPLELVEPLAAVHQHLVTCAPSISQGAALAALAPRGGRAARRIRGRLAESRELMDRELSRLAGIHYRRPDGGLYYFIQVNGCTDSERLAFSILEREQVITIPGVAFGPGGEGCLRLSFAASDEDIVAGIAGVGRVLSG